MYSFTKEQLVRKIAQVYCIDRNNAMNLAEYCIKHTPHKFQRNICEWIEGECLTDIYAGRYSVPMIMAIWKSKDFLEALFVVTELEKGDADKAERQIWNMRR